MATPPCSAWAAPPQCSSPKDRRRPRRRRAAPAARTGFRRRSRCRGSATREAVEPLRIAAEMLGRAVADVGQPDRIELVQSRHRPVRVPPLAGEPRNRATSSWSTLLGVDVCLFHGAAFASPHTRLRTPNHCQPAPRDAPRAIVHAPSPTPRTVDVSTLPLQGGLKEQGAARMSAAKSGTVSSSAPRPLPGFHFVDLGLHKSPPPSPTGTCGARPSPAGRVKEHSSNETGPRPARADAFSFVTHRARTRWSALT